MPKIAPIFIAVLCAAFVVSACSNNNSTPNTTPRTAPTPSQSPDPRIHVAVLQVTVSGTPTVNIPVALSTPANPKNPVPGTPIRTTKTGADGVVRFGGLSYKYTYCFVATLQQSPLHQAAICAPPTIWQFTDPLIIGT